MIVNESFDTDLADKATALEPVDCSTRRVAPLAKVRAAPTVGRSGVLWPPFYDLVIACRFLLGLLGRSYVGQVRASDLLRRLRFDWRS